MKNHTKFFLMGTFAILFVSLLLFKYSNATPRLSPGSTANAGQYVNFSNATVLSVGRVGKSLLIATTVSYQNTPRIQPQVGFLNNIVSSAIAAFAGGAIAQNQINISTNSTTQQTNYYTVDTTKATFPSILGVSGLENPMSIVAGDVISVSGSLNGSNLQSSQYIQQFIPSNLYTQNTNLYTQNSSYSLLQNNVYIGNIIADTISDASFLNRSLFEGIIISTNKDGSFTFNSHSVNLCGSPINNSTLKQKCSEAGCYVSDIASDLQDACTKSGCFSTETINVPLKNTPHFLTKICDFSGCYNVDPNSTAGTICARSGCYATSSAKTQNLCLSALSPIVFHSYGSSIGITDINMGIGRYLDMLVSFFASFWGVPNLHNLNNNSTLSPVNNNTVDQTKDTSVLYNVRPNVLKKATTIFSKGGKSIKTIRASDLIVGDSVKVFVDTFDTRQLNDLLSQKTGLILNPSVIEDDGSASALTAKQLLDSNKIPAPIQDGQKVNVGKNIYNYTTNP